MRVSRIEVFPIKSLDAVRVAESVITSGGILEHDREYAIFDREGKVVNGKRTPEIHRLRSTFDDTFREVCLWEAGGGSSPARFNLSEPEPIHHWLSDFFGYEVILRHDPIKGFPDDPDAFGPTIVSEASLRRVVDWYPGWTLEGARRRFRSNIEVAGGEAFCEDGLFGAPGERKTFRIGSVRFLGHNPCQRCVVPSRDPDRGDVTPGFQKDFAELRKRELPAWADVRRFNHYYRFALNTSVPSSEGGKRVRVGDALALLQSNDWLSSSKSS
jgi:uncharacterized protein YcbX